MPRKTRTYIVGGDSASNNNLTPKHLKKQEFGKRLYKLMVAKGWNQSELARQAGLNRDAVSTYIRGRAMPTPLSAKALADALGVSMEGLLPNHAESAIEEDMPALEIKVSASAPSAAWVKVNRLVSMATAVAIAQLLQDDDVTERIGSGGASKVQSLKDQEASIDGKTDVSSWATDSD